MPALIQVLLRATATAKRDDNNSTDASALEALSKEEAEDAIMPGWAFIVLFAVVALIVIGGLAYLWQQRRRRKQLERDRATFMLLTQDDSEEGSDEDDEIFHL